MKKKGKAAEMNALLSLRKTIVYPVFGVLLLALAAWGQPEIVRAGAGLPPTSGSAQVFQSSAIGGYAELVAALQAAGATVTPGGDIDQPFIPVKGHLITVNNADVQVFEFQDEATRQQVSDAISQAQNSINTSLSTGISGPSFWATGRLIVLYIGDDQATIGTLTKILGNPLAQASAAAGPPSQATLAAQKRLATALGVSTNQVQLVSAEQASWPNTCLGLTPSGQACAAKVTPGWRMIFNANGQQYEVRTDETASTVRWQPQAGPGTSIGELQSQATSAEKQLEKDVQQVGLKGELTKLEKELNGFKPQLTQAWNVLQSQAAIAWRDLNRMLSQLGKDIQASGISKK